KPEPYTDYQMCGALKPECTPETLVSYIREYFRKATSGHGYGHAIQSLPHLLVVHLPQPGRVGETEGWQSAACKQALKSVDQAMGAVLDLYKDLGLLKQTTVFVTALTSYGAKPQDIESAPAAANGAAVPRVPWIASGIGIKPGHTIQQPVLIIDTGATEMRTLGLETYTEWQSHSVEEAFTTPPSIRPRTETALP